AIRASIPSQLLPRAGAAASSATTLPVRPVGAEAMPVRPAERPRPLPSATPLPRATAPRATAPRATAPHAAQVPASPAAQVPALPVLPSRPPPLPVPTRLDSEAGDEATTVEPPLFPLSEPDVDARPPEEVYVPPPPQRTGKPELPALHRWGLVGAVLLIPIVIGLLAYACRGDARPSRSTPASIEP
ncbi:MAG: hypothetical protein ABI467_23365, partial [Kofleriaceae bacterium]